VTSLLDVEPVERSVQFFTSPTPLPWPSGVRRGSPGGNWWKTDGRLGFYMILQWFWAPFFKIFRPNCYVAIFLNMCSTVMSPVTGKKLILPAQTVEWHNKHNILGSTSHKTGVDCRFMPRHIFSIINQLHFFWAIQVCQILLIEGISLPSSWLVDPEQSWESQHW